MRVDKRLLVQLGLTLLISTSSVKTEVDVPNDEEWISCSEFQETASLPHCMCSVAEDEGFRINCDHVVFGQDFPTLPFRQPISYFSQRFVRYQNIPPQAFIPSQVPLRTLDLSNNWLRRLTDKSLEGLAETLEILDLNSNLLGDQINPIFTTNEFKRLPRLKVLALGSNFLSHIDAGILEGCLSLEELYLDDNDLKSVPSTKGPKALKILDLSVNSISDLKAVDFIHSQALIFLNMSHNQLVQIEGGTFSHLTNLKYLDLSSNRLQRLNSDSFNGLENTLEEIDLNFNFLSQIPIAALKVLSSLRVLKLSGNLLQNLEITKDLRALQNLEVLDMSRNRISEIPPNFFKGMDNLKELNLAVNQLSTFSSSVGLSRPGLISLNLMDNKLLKFPSDAIDNITTLQSLTLDYNRISALTPNTTQNLTKLSISHNLIGEIPSETFTKYPFLASLNLRGNLITNLDEVLLPTTLQEMDIGFNQIRSIPRFQLPYLDVLKADHNLVAGLLQHNFVLLGNLRELDLSHNMISSVYGNSFDGLDSVETLNMAGNRLEYLPKLQNMYELETLNFSKNLLKEIGVMENLLSLKYLDLSHNQISTVKPIEYFMNTSLIEIRLNHNKMSKFQGLVGSFDRLKTLDLSNNMMTYVYPNSFDSVGQLWNLKLDNNRFTLFPTEFLKPCKHLRSITLSHNQIKNLEEMNFSNFPHLRELDLSSNILEFIGTKNFVNSTQIQFLNLAGNKLEALNQYIFDGILRLELDLSNNYLSSLPATIFERTRVQKLHRLSISSNAFSEIPYEALQRQYFFLENLEMKENRITEVPQNLNILVNVKHLDLGYNPLSEHSLKNILSEPKTVRSLSLANCSVKFVPKLEMPFLRMLNLSHNPIRGFNEEVFERTTLLEGLDLSYTDIYTLDTNFPGSVRTLDLSGTLLNTISGTVFPIALQKLKLNNLEMLMKVEKTALNLKNLRILELYNAPKLGYLDIRGLLNQLNFLEEFDFEVKDHQIADQLHPGLNARVKRVGLGGRRVRAISSGAFAGLTSPEVEISLVNTSLHMLPSILLPVPMSSKIVLDLSDSKITNLSPPFLTQNIKLQGISPICDCNAVNLVKYLKMVNSRVICAGPKNLRGRNVLDLSLEELTCEPGSSTTPPPIPSTLRTTTTQENDIIWSLAPSTTGRTTNHGFNDGRTKSRGHSKSDTPLNKVRPHHEINNMDSLIFGIVGGVIVLILIFVIIIVCFVKLSNGSNSEIGHSPFPQIAPSVLTMGHNGGAKCTCPHKPDPHAMILHHQGGYATLRSNSKYLNQLNHGKYATLNPGGGGGGPGSIYALHPSFAGVPSGVPSLSMYPTTNTMTLGPASSVSMYNANPTYAYSAAYAPPPPPSSNNHQLQQQQQQNSIYGTMPYNSHLDQNEYDTRRFNRET